MGKITIGKLPKIANSDIRKSTNNLAVWNGNTTKKVSL